MAKNTQPRVNGNSQYVKAVVFMALLGAAAAVLISIFRSSEDNLAVIALVFASLAPTTVAMLAFMKAQETHLSVNSRLDSLIKNAEGVARAAGIEQGRLEADARTDKLKDNKNK